MSADVAIRRATPSDAARISLLTQTIQTLHAAAMPERFKPADASTFPVALVEQLLERLDCIVLVAEITGRVVGYLYAEVQEVPESAIKHAARRILIHHMVADEDRRRLGVGTQLLAEIRRIAGEWHIPELVLDVWDFNAAAHLFYRSAGFQDTRHAMSLRLDAPVTSQVLMQASWTLAAHEFAADGALRDIYVQQTTLADWEKMLGLVRAHYAPLTLLCDGDVVPQSMSVTEMFARRADASMAFVWTVSGIELVCHLFTPDEIELSLSPATVDSADRFAALEHFLRTLATTLGKRVRLTSENMPDAPILSVDPGSDVVRYHPAPGAATG